MAMTTTATMAPAAAAALGPPSLHSRPRLRRRRRRQSPRRIHGAITSPPLLLLLVVAVMVVLPSPTHATWIQRISSLWNRGGGGGGGGGGVTDSERTYDAGDNDDYGDGDDVKPVDEGEGEEEDEDDEEEEEDYYYPAVRPRRNLVDEFGEEGYRQRLADAFGWPDDPADSSTSDADVKDSATGEEGADEGAEKEASSTPVEYGVDVSYPIHHATVSTNYPWLEHNLEPHLYSPAPEYADMPIQPLGDKQSFYEEYMAGCRAKYGRSKGKWCDENEEERIDMNLRQPMSMQNYTDIGFKRIRAPKKVYDLLLDFWRTNQDQQYIEQWPEGNTYVNHWSSPTHMLSVENTELPGGGLNLKNRIWDAARSTIQEWTGERLTPCSLYGIRVYREGAVLAPHVDRLPLVSSAIINVAQDVDEPWPIEVYAHDGKAYNVTMEPGDMILYESHSVVHGRPFPLKGRYYANVFIHFEPTGHSLRHEQQMKEKDPEASYEKALEEGVDDGWSEEDEEEEEYEEYELPSYIMKGSEEERRWRQQHPQAEDEEYDETTFDTGTTISAHSAASLGDLDFLEELAEFNVMELHKKDKNGWMPIHEAARGGHADVVEFLVEKGTNINERTNDGRGGTPLWWAKTTHGENHPVVKLLQKLGALEIGPEL